MKKLRFTFSSFFVTAAVILMMLSDLFVSAIPDFFGYSDEALGIICFVMILAMIMTRRYIPGKFISLVLLLIIGLIGNIFAGIQNSLYVAASDAFTFFKPYIILLCVLMLVDTLDSRYIYDSLMFISKLMLLVLTFLAIVTLFTPMNMVSQNGDFKFLVDYSGTVSWWSILFFSLVYSGANNHRIFYYICTAVVVLRNGSGLGALALALAALVYLFAEKRRKFRWYYIIPIVLVCVIVSRNEISEYLLTDTAPRINLIMYGFVTAATFFPIGSGFATYGSAGAARNYSALYVKYGFDSTYGMSQNYHPYLLDSYFPQVIGQFGVIGTILYVYFFANFVKRNVLMIQNKQVKLACIYILICWAAAGIGFGTGSLWGCSVFCVVAIFAKLAEPDFLDS